MMTIEARGSKIEVGTRVVGRVGDKLLRNDQSVSRDGAGVLEAQGLSHNTRLFFPLDTFQRLPSSRRALATKRINSFIDRPC